MKVRVQTCMQALVAALLAAALPAASAAKDVVLVLRGEGITFEQAAKGLSQELGAEFRVHQLLVSSGTTVDDVRKAIAQNQPHIAVLMDNRAIGLLREYQKTVPDSTKPLASVSLMAVAVGDAIKSLRNATGISYEVPMVTSAIALRSLGFPVAKVGVIHRQFMSETVGQNAEYCAREKVHIVSVAIPDKSGDVGGDIRRAIRTLVDKEKVDALWIPNDNVLLKPEVLRQEWIPRLADSRKPVMVGVEVLVNPALDFGTFAVLPSHVELGSQAAQLVVDIRDGGWNAGGVAVQQPLAVYKIINVQQARRMIRIGEQALSHVDKVAE